MVQVETSQLTAECNTWRDALRKLRDEFTQHKNNLQQAASHSLSKDQLQQVEHLQNQFHIQLINIHDLKHAIKAQGRMIDFEMQDAGHLKEETFAKHEELFDQYQNLNTTLQELRGEFDKFLVKT
jgi:seryl-tRNA synthetase